MYPNGWVFLGDALVRPRQAFDRAKNVAYWWPVCGVTAAVASLGYLTVLYSSAFEVGNGSAFRGVVFGHLALLAPPVFVVSCMGLLSIGAGH
jgi:hypothetical protein